MSIGRDVRPFIKKLCSERFEFDRKEDPTDLFVLLRDNCQLLCTLTKSNWSSDDTIGWKNVKINLETLIGFLIDSQKENLSKLDIGGINALLYNLENVIFPYLSIFPRFSGNILIVVRETLLLRKDKDCELNAFMKNLSSSCQEIVFPFDCIEIDAGLVGTPFEKNAKAINSFIAEELQTRFESIFKEVEKEVKDISNRNLTLPELDYAKKIPHEFKTDAAKSKTLICLWLDIVSQLKDQYHSDETRYNYTLFWRMFSWFKEGMYRDVMITALAGIMYKPNKTTAKLLADFLGIPLESDLEAFVKKCCQKQFEILRYLEINFTKLIEFLDTNQLINRTRELNFPTEYLKEKIYKLIQNLRSDGKFHKNPTELFAILTKSIDTFHSLALNADKHDNSQIFKKFRVNLHKLLLFVIHNKHFVNLHESAIKVHLVNLKKLFPFIEVFGVDNAFLRMARDILVAHRDLNSELESFVNDLIAHNKKVALSYTRIKTNWPWSQPSPITGMEQKLVTELDQRVALWEKPVQALIDQFRSIEPPKLTVERKALEAGYKQYKKKDTFTRLWLNLLSLLLDKHDDEQTFNAYTIFCGIYESLNNGSIEKAIQHALAGIAIHAKNSRFKIQARRLAVFLGMHFLGSNFEFDKSREYVREFCLWQFQIIESLRLEFEEFLQFLEDHPNHRKGFIEIVRTIPHKPKADKVPVPKTALVAEVKDEKEFKAVVFDYNFIDQLRSAKSGLHHRFPPAELLTILDKHGESLRLFALEPIYHNNDEEMWVNFNSNLEQLLKAVIRPKNLIVLSSTELAAHLTVMRNAIFPFIKYFPTLSEELLKLVQDIFACPTHCDKIWQLDTFVNDIIQLNSRSSIPFSRITTPLAFTSAEMVNVEKSIELVLTQREDKLCSTLDGQMKRLRHKSEAMKLMFDKCPSELKCHHVLEKPLLKLASLWLNIADRLQTDPHNEETHALCALFSEIYLHLNHDLMNDAITIAFAGISLWNNTHKQLTKFIYGFLEIPTDTMPYERRLVFCQRQYDVIHRIEGDLENFNTFLKDNPDHFKLFTTVLSATSTISAPQLQTYSRFASTTPAIADDPSTPDIEYATAVQPL